jgi:hypothetical protein
LFHILASLFRSSGRAAAVNQRFRPKVESLEDRTVPAAILNSTLVNGTLTITAVNSNVFGENDQVITIQGNGAGAFNIATNGDLRGPAAASPTGVTNIKLNLGAGNDKVTIIDADLAGTLTVLGGTGNNSVFLNGTDNQFGNISIVNGMGIDLFQADAAIAVTGNLTVNNGHGDTKFLLNADTEIGGNLSLINTGGIDIFTSKAKLDVNGNLTMNNGAGTVRLTFDGETDIGGNFSVVNGYGGDTTDFNGQLKIAGNLSLNYGTSNDVIKTVDAKGNVVTVQLTGSSTNFNDLAAAEIGGNLTIRGQDGIDRVVLDGVTVKGTTLFDLGNQDDVVLLTDSIFGGRSTVNTGNGNDTLRLENDENGSDTEFQSTVTISAGAGNDVLTVGRIDGDRVTFKAAPVRFDGGLGLDGIAYESGATSPSGPRTNIFLAGDPIVTSWGQAVNEPPAIAAPASVDSGGTGTFAFNGAELISIADPDAGNAIVQVRLTVANGDLTFADTTGLVFSVGDGISDPSMTFRGTITDINNALINGLTWNGTADTTLNIFVNDLGNTGAGGPLTDFASVVIDNTP